MPECEDRHVKTELGDIVFIKDIVITKLKQLDPSKSPGPDGMHLRVLKELAEELAEPLAMIFTKSKEESKLPDTGKEANVPLFKKGNRSKPSNYGPVSLRPIAGVGGCLRLDLATQYRIFNFTHFYN